MNDVAQVAIFLSGIVITGVGLLAYYCGYNKGRCDEMDAQKTVDIRIDPPKVTVMEKVK